MEELGKALDAKDAIAVLPPSTDESALSEPPLFDEYYLDWAVFDLAVASAIEKHHPIRKRSSLTFEVYNRTVSKGRHDRKPIAEFLSKTFKCTHGIKFRSRGTGKRSRHKLRDIGCPFHIYATAVEDPGGYRVKVRTHDKHNHPIGPDAIKTVGALHDSDYEYTDAHASTLGDPSAILVDAPRAAAHEPNAGTHLSGVASDLVATQAANALHVQATMLHSHANAADILDVSEQDSEVLLASAIDSHIHGFTAAAAAVASAAAASVVPDTPPAASMQGDHFESKFEESTTLEGLRRKLCQFATDRDWDQFHSPRNLLLALAGEMGELCECFQWKGDNKPVEEWTSDERVHLGDEISDVMMYLIRLADKCDIDLPSAIHEKMAKNAQRFPPELVRGSAKKFNEFKRARIDRETSL